MKAFLPWTLIDINVKLGRVFPRVSRRDAHRLFHAPLTAAIAAMTMALIICGFPGIGLAVIGSLAIAGAGVPQQ
jgi:hypothetical protein